MPNPSPPSGHPQGDGTRLNKARSDNARGSHNARRRNHNRHQGVSRSSYKVKQAEIKDHVYNVGGIRGGNDLFDKTTHEITDFVSRSIKGGGEFQTAMDLDDLGFQLLIEPPFPDDDDDELEVEQWKLRIRRIDERRAVRDEVTRQVFAIVKGQCSPTVVDQIEASHDWSTIHQQHDLIELLTLIRQSLYTGATTWNPVHALWDAYNCYQSFRQGTWMSCFDYLREFTVLVTTVQQLGGELGMEASRMREELNNDETVMDANNPTKEEETRARNAAREAFLAVDFLAKSDMKRFGSLLAELENLYTCGVDGYPVTLTSSFDMVVNYRDPSKYCALTCDMNEDGMSFFNDQGEPHDQQVSQSHGHSGHSAMGRGGHGGHGCGNGGGWGRGQHSEQGSNFYQALADNDDYHDNGPGQIEEISHKQSVPCSHHIESHIHNSPLKPFDTETPECWLMLDSCSTLNLISNKSWLLDLYEVDTAMHIHSTGGVSVTHKMGYLGNYPTPVWYLAGGHANILSLWEVTWHYRVTMDTATENALILHGDNGQQHKFTPLGKGLYKWEHTMDPTEDNPCWLFVTTVCGQGDCYTQRAYKHAQAVRCLQNIIIVETTVGR